MVVKASTQIIHQPRSAKRIGQGNETEVEKNDWTPSKNNREALKDEDTRMNQNVGAEKSDQNYN